MRQASLVPATLLVTALFASPVLASDLKVDGQASVGAVIGTSVALELTGNPALPAFIAADIANGPVSVFGESLPIGFSPALFIPAQGATDGGGLFTGSLFVPPDPNLVGKKLYFLGLIIDPADANGLDFSAGAEITFTLPQSSFTEAELAGVARVESPYFAWITTTREGDDLEIAVDLGAHPGLAGTTADVYVTADKSAVDWDQDPLLIDQTLAGATTVTLNGAGIVANTFTVDTGTLLGDTGAGLGVGYDVVVDANQNGVLDAGDLLDGYDAAGFYVASDPAASGPYAVTEALYTGGLWLGQALFYPSNIAQLGQLPVVVVSHGNGHNYLWYDHIGQHLASHGYIVMSHENNTMPGIQSASLSTLANTDYLLGNLDLIEGGALQGHVDAQKLVWIGHSRGGEGVTRAYDRLVDGTYTPQHFGPDDIALISSIAPTTYLLPEESTPHDKPYCLWVGVADADVTGCPTTDNRQSFPLFGRAENQRQSISIYGAGHADFHANDFNPDWWATGPCKIGQPTTHEIMRGYLYPLVEYHTRGNPAAKDFLWRQYEEFHPQSAPASNPCVVVALQFRDAAGGGKRVIDDFQGAHSTTVASSGATISSTTDEWATGLYEDVGGGFAYNPSETFNGFTYVNPGDTESGGVLTFTQDSAVVYDLALADEDWSGFGSLSFRACQVTRHPLTNSALGDTDFTVRLVDGDGDSSSMRVSASGSGLEEPYRRTACGLGVGWASEFETIRLQLAGFAAAAPALDLDRIERLEFLFGPSHGYTVGRIGLDDIELCVD